MFPTIWGTYMKLVTKFLPYMFNVYKNQQSRQTGSRNLMGPKMFPTIWGTYMKLVTKFLPSIVAEKNATKNSNYWWQKFDIWSQASYRYPISWEAFFDPSDSYILFAEDRGYHRWALAHSSSCLLLVRTLYGVTKFMICYWSVHCMLRSSLWFVTGQNVVCYDQVYDLLLVSTLYVMTKFMICCWSEHCMLRPSLWFVAGQNVVCYDQVYHLLLVRTKCDEKYPWTDGRR
jgi:hypothetical protein